MGMKENGQQPGKETGGQGDGQAGRWAGREMGGQGRVEAEHEHAAFQ